MYRRNSMHRYNSPYFPGRPYRDSFISGIRTSCPPKTMNLFSKKIRFTVIDGTKNKESVTKKHLLERYWRMSFYSYIKYSKITNTTLNRSFFLKLFVEEINRLKELEIKFSKSRGVRIYFPKMTMRDIIIKKEENKKDYVVNMVYDSIEPEIVTYFKRIEKFIEKFANKLN